MILQKNTVRVNQNETCPARLREGRPGDAAACAAINDAWIAATDWMPRVHPPDAIARFYRAQLFVVCRVLVAERDGLVAGFLAVDGEGLIAALFVAEKARGGGIGGALVAAAQALRPEGLSLWTFVANAGARRFYARHGFVEAGATGGDNDEGLADVLLTWRAVRVSARGDWLPVATVTLGIVALWYLFAVILNAPWAYDQAGRDGVKLGFGDLVAATLSQERPRLPAPRPGGG